MGGRLIISISTTVSHSYCPDCLFSERYDDTDRMPHNGLFACKLNGNIRWFHKMIGGECPIKDGINITVKD